MFFFRNRTLERRLPRSQRTQPSLQGTVGSFAPDLSNFGGRTLLLREDLSAAKGQRKETLLLSFALSKFTRKARHRGRHNCEAGSTGLRHPGGIHLRTALPSAGGPAEDPDEPKGAGSSPPTSEGSLCSFTELIPRGVVRGGRPFLVGADQLFGGRQWGVNPQAGLTRDRASGDSGRVGIARGGKGPQSWKVLGAAKIQSYPRWVAWGSRTTLLRWGRPRGVC